jgi:hypothetical protein
MNRFGTKDLRPGQSYCENRMRMDRFMVEAVMSIGATGAANNKMRERYKSHVSTLGKLKDAFCERSDYFGRDYMPGGHTTYIGIE